jgi:glycosyltransferase involved in cell wall biosynthesis
MVGRMVLRDRWELPGRPRRRALLAYLVHPLLPPRCLRDRVMFSNRGLAQEWVRALNRLDFAVDVVGWSNSRWTPDRQYDLFVGHGGVNFSRIADCLPAATVKIYFGTGLHQGVQNQRAAARSEDLRRRRGIEVPPDRFVGGDEVAAYARADAIVCLGDSRVAESFRPHPRVFSLSNAVFPLGTTRRPLRDFEAARGEFLFFAGRGNLHKGLDLLLEAFVDLPCQLHVCQHLQPQFASAFRRELARDNIHVHGFVRMRSRRYRELARRCAWTILPTCAEGQPGSVLEGMAFGLVPILPDSANIPIDSWGVRLEGLTVADTRAAVHAASRLSTDSVADLSARASRAAAVEFSVGRFRRDLTHVLRTILDGPTQRQSAP